MTRTSRQSEDDSNDTRTVVVTLAIAALVAGVAFFGILTLGGEDDKPTSVPAAATVSGASVAGVAVAVPSVDLGRVPLDKNVNQTFTLRNGGTGKAQLGKPRIETLEGC